jgi:hypothetical protein
MKGIEYVYQLPIMKEQLRDCGAVEMVTLSTAVFCAVCWIAPKISWKKTL